MFKKIWDEGKAMIGELPMSVVMFFVVVGVIKLLAWVLDHVKPGLGDYVRGAGKVA